MPFLALAAVVPAVWGWGLSWLDVGLAVGFYYLTLLGVTVGYHRHFTHGSFKAKRPLRLGAGRRRLAWRSRARSSSGSPTTAGTTPSPTARATRTRRGATAPTCASLLKGMFHAHLGWLFDRRKTNQERYAPDLLKDGGLVVTSRLFVVWAFLSLAAARRHRRAGHRHLGRRLVGVLLGRPGARRAAAPRDLVDQLGLPRRRQPARSSPARPGDQLLAAGDPQRRRVLAQPAPRRPDLRPARRAARPDRHQRPRDLGVREARLGARTSSGPTRCGWPPSAATPSTAAGLTAGTPAPPPGRPHSQAPGRSARDEREDGARDQQRARPRVRMTGAQRRQQLLDVGRELFAQRGYEATSIEEIAARADVSKPVVYEHFGGKEGLYAVVVDREMQLLLDRFTSALSAPGHPRELLERAALVLLDYIEDDTDGFRVLTRDAPVTSGVGTFSSLIGEVARKVEHILGRQFDARGYDPQLAELYSQALVGMVALVGQWWLDTRSPDKREVAAHLVNLAYNGLAHLEPRPGLVDGAGDRPAR